MSGFKKFEDDEDPEDNKGDNTSSMFQIQEPTLNYAREFRNEKLDMNFRRNLIGTWLKMLFPHFKLISLTSAYALILIIFYVIEILLWINNSWSCVTYTFGSNYTPAIHRWHLQRLILPAFLHNDFPHLGWNLFVLAAVGMNAEHYLGTLGYAALIGTAILLGNVFTAGFRSDI